MEGIELQSAVRLPIAERSQAAEARRVATAMARALGFSDVKCAEAAIIVTEAGNNLANHARGGELVLNASVRPGGPCLTVYAIDHGPGMHLERSLRDGYSTYGTSGTGLGAVQRLANTFAGWSDSAGTVLLAEVFAAPPDAPSFYISGIRVPKLNESDCGDNWTYRPVGRGIAVLAADGLGHGAFAAEASREAVDAFQRTEWYGVGDALEQVHAALRGTRGAAVAIAHVDPAQGVVNYAGLGNIGAQVMRPGRPQNMVSHNGTAGHTAPKMGQFQYPWDRTCTLILHTDGLLTQWSIDKYPGVLLDHPGLIAGLLYRDYSRGRDDVGVVALKEA